MQLMESQDLSPPHADASRPSLGFPLGTALLLIIIFSLSGIFSCCYHWDRFRSLRQSFAQDPDHEADIEASPSKSKLICTVLCFEVHYLGNFPTWDSMNFNNRCLCLRYFFSTGFEAKSQPKLACVDAWGSDSKVHSIAMSM